MWNQDYGNGKLNVGDLVDPTVTVTVPERRRVAGRCSTVNLTWTATDTQSGVTGVDLELSRSGAGGPYESIATGLSNTGTYSWTVTGPLTSDALLRVTATDGAANVGSDLSNAAFSIASPVITASAGAGGSISPSGPVSVACGGTQAFTITADACFHVADVLVDGVSVGAVSGYTFTNVQANHTIAASFAVDQYTITASAGTGGSIAPSGAVVVSCGADQAFNVTADACYSIADVLVDGVSVGAVSSYTFTNVQADHTISASFSLNSYTITASAGLGGSIAPSGAVVVACGETQAFTITADGCYTIADVLVDGLSVGAVSGYTFTNVQANHTIAASFTLTSYTITASAGAGGSIAPSGAVAVACGADQAFTVTPDACFTISDVLVDGVSVGAVSGYTFTNVQADHTIAASFTLSNYTITASAGTGGSIAPSGPVSVSCGGNQAFTITPDAGYHVLDVLVDGGSVGAVTAYAFTNVQADHTIAASFEVNSYTVTVAVVGQGTVARDPDLTSYPHGTSLSLTATPADGFGFSGWSGDITSTDNPLVVSVTSNLNLTATFVDVVAPTVQLVSPNGGERLVVGAVRTVDWTATDNVEVTGVDLYVSRDNGATYTELVASGLPNSGSYDWVVTGPGTNDADDIMTNFLKVVAHDGPNTASDVSDAGFEIINLAAGISAALPSDFALAPPSPNPAHGPALISYAVPRDANVKLRIVDVQGREVIRLVDGVVPAGRYQVRWNGAGSDGRFLSGVFFVRMESGPRVFTRRLSMAR